MSSSLGGGRVHEAVSSSRGGTERGRGGEGACVVVVIGTRKRARARVKVRRRLLLLSGREGGTRCRHHQGEGEGGVLSVVIVVWTREEVRERGRIIALSSLGGGRRVGGWGCGLVVVRCCRCVVVTCGGRDQSGRGQWVRTSLTRRCHRRGCSEDARRPSRTLWRMVTVAIARLLSHCRCRRTDVRVVA